MGTWGHGYFEDDSALDFMANVEESKNPKKILSKAFEKAIKADYIESDEGSAIIVAAAYIDRKLNGTLFTLSGQSDPISVDTFFDRYPDQDFSDLKPKAILTLVKVLEEDSELNELWMENENDYAIWRDGIKQMIKRLTPNLS